MADPVKAEEHADEAHGVTEDGTPATPAAQVAEKQKQKQRTYVGIALAAVGVVVAVFVSKKNAAAQQQAQAGTAAYPNLSGNVAGGPDTSALSDFQNELGGLQSQNSQLSQQLASQQSQSNAALSSLQQSIAKLTAELNSKGGTGPEQRAHINSADYPQFLPGLTSKMDVFGTVQGGKIVGGNVGASGAPVYALFNTGFGPVWEQDFNVSQLPAGTQIATSDQFAQYVHGAPPPIHGAPPIVPRAN